MSYTELYKVCKDGHVESYAEFRNSHRGASLVWMQMSRRYLGRDANLLNMEPVWDLWRNQSVPLADRIVMASTFDNVMVRRTEFKRLCDAIAEYCQRIDGGTLPEQAQAITQLLDDDDCIAVCWNQTSVNADGTWWVYDDDEDDDDDGRAYNINADHDHWYLFDESDLARWLKESD